MIPFAAYAPDRSQFDQEASDTLENVLPVQGGYGPFPQFSPLFEPLPEKPQGAFLAYVDNGSYHLFAGSETKLWKADGPSLSWVDVSKDGGYSTAISENWSFSQFGDWLIATNGVDPVQYIDLNTPDQFGDLSLDAPRAKFVGSIGDFVMLANLADDKRMVRWSGLNQPQFWTPRQRSADFQAFHDGGEITGYSSGVVGCVIFHAESIREGALALETSLVMRFRQTVNNHGCIAPRSIVTTGGGIYYLSQDGFFRYGAPPVSIGVERVDNSFFDDIEAFDIYNVQGIEDPFRKIVYWAYRSKSNPEGSLDKVLMYHYGIDRWSILKLDLPIISLLNGSDTWFTLDGLDELGVPLVELPFSLDVWSGGSPVLAAFDTSFRLGFFAGDSMRAVLQTGEIQMTTGRRSFVTGFRPLSDAFDISGRVAAQDRAGGSRNWKQPFTVSTRTGLIPARASGRFHRFEVTIPASQKWTTIHGVEPEGGQEGDQ